MDLGFTVMDLGVRAFSFWSLLLKLDVMSRSCNGSWILAGV